MYDGKAAIHMAVIESYLPIVRLLIEYKANLDIKVGHMYIHAQTSTYIYSVHLISGTLQKQLAMLQTHSIYTSLMYS